MESEKGLQIFTSLPHHLLLTSVLLVMLGFHTSEQCIPLHSYTEATTKTSATSQELDIDARSIPWNTPTLSTASPSSWTVTSSPDAIVTSSNEQAMSHRPELLSKHASHAVTLLGLTVVLTFLAVLVVMIAVHRRRQRNSDEEAKSLLQRPGSRPAQDSWPHDDVTAGGLPDQAGHPRKGGSLGASSYYDSLDFGHGREQRQRAAGPSRAPESVAYSHITGRQLRTGAGDRRFAEPDETGGGRDLGHVPDRAGNC